MGLLDFFSKPKGELKLDRLPSGSFTMDRSGKLLGCTLSQTFTDAYALEIGQLVLATFASASAAKLPLTELFIHYGSFKITAREQRGGALIFLAPVR